jgi:hypothetical protein
MSLRRAPYAFTEHGVAMLSSVLKSKYDRQFKVVFDAIRRRVIEPAPKSRPIGFAADLDS